MPVKKYRRQQSENAFSDSSVSIKDISSLVSGDEPILLAPASRDYPPIVTVPASPTVDQATTDDTPYSRASPIEQATGDIEPPTSPGTTDQLQRYTRVNRPVSRTTACPRLPDGQEQPEDQYRPMTPGEEEIMRIHEDGIYCSPDMIEKSGGFWNTSSSTKPGESCSLQTAP